MCVFLSDDYMIMAFSYTAIWFFRELSDNSVDFGSFLLAERRAMEAEERAAIAEEKLQETQDQMFYFNTQFSDPFSSSSSLLVMPSVDMLGLPPPPPSFELPDPPTFTSIVAPSSAANLLDIPLIDPQNNIQAAPTDAEQQLIPPGTSLKLRFLCSFNTVFKLSSPFLFLLLTEFDISQLEAMVSEITQQRRRMTKSGGLRRNTMPLSLSLSLSLSLFASFQLVPEISSFNRIFHLGHYDRCSSHS